jgi:mycothione reductase
MADFDLAIIGSGSGNSLVTDDFADKRVALVSSGIFGGTCLNVGCIPTKMYVYAAEVAGTVSDAGRYGIDAKLEGVRWPDIRDRIFGRIDPISAGGRDWRERSDNVTLLEGRGAFTGPRQLNVDGAGAFTADQVVIATGGRPVIPEVIGASGVPFHTSDTVMRIDELPASMVILGGGYIAAEFAHVFSRLGVDVRIVSRGSRLLGAMDPEISRRFTELAGARWELHLSALATAVHGDDRGVAVETSTGETVRGDMLLVAAGRRPNSDGMDLGLGGVEVHPDGRVVVDRFGRTTAAGVWALGDVSSPFQLKHVANSEARTVAHNLVHPDDLRVLRHQTVPSAVFTEPQIASVGATSTELEAAGRPFVTATQAYGSTAYGWAMEDQDGICRLYADPATGLLLGAHVLGYQASTLIQPLIQAMSFGQRVTDVAEGQYWIHPALAEVVENALLSLDLG